MKKILYIIGVSLLVACSGTKETTVSKGDVKKVRTYSYQEPYHYDKTSAKDISAHEMKSDRKLQTENIVNNEVYANVGDEISVSKNPLQEKVKHVNQTEDNFVFKAVKRMPFGGGKWHILSIVGFVLWVLGFVIPILGTVGFILSIVNLFTLKKRKDEFKGKAFAIVPVAVTMVLLFLSALIFLFAASLLLGTSTWGAGLVLAIAAFFLILALLLGLVLLSYSKG